MIYEGQDGRIHAQVSGHGEPLQSTPEGLKSLIGDAIDADSVSLLAKRH